MGHQKDVTWSVGPRLIVSSWELHGHIHRQTHRDMIQGHGHGPPPGGGYSKVLVTTLRNLPRPGAHGPLARRGGDGRAPSLPLWWWFCGLVSRSTHPRPCVCYCVCVNYKKKTPQSAPPKGNHTIPFLPGGRRETVGPGRLLRGAEWETDHN